MLEVIFVLQYGRLTKVPTKERLYTMHEGEEGSRGMTGDVKRKM